MVTESKRRAGSHNGGRISSGESLNCFIIKGVVEKWEGDDEMSEETKMILEKLERLESKMNSMESKMNNMQLTLENETNRNIQIIAEGHANLNRRLDEALKMENEKEMLLIRVNRLENELRQIKERIAGIA